MPIAPSGIAPLVSLVSRDTQLSQIGHLRSGLLPLLPAGHLHRLVLSLLCSQCSALLHTLCVPHYLFAGSPRSLGRSPRSLGILLSTHRPPFRSVLETYDRSALPLKKTQGTMALADFLQFVVTAVFGFSYLPSARPPRVRTTTFLPCNRRIYRTGFGQHWTLCWIAHSSVPVRPTM